MSRLRIFAASASFVSMIVSQAVPIGANAAELAPDAMNLILHRAGCEDMLKRRTENFSGIRALRCDAVAQDEQGVRAPYANNPAVLRALDGNWVKVVQRSGAVSIPSKADR